MSIRKTLARVRWRDSFSLVALIGGLILTMLSFAWPAVSTGRSEWSDQQAVEYQAASSELHRLSLQIGSTPPEDQSRAKQKELADAQSKYAALRAELDAARRYPTRIAAVLWYTGIFLLICGLIDLARTWGKHGA